jgi:hypothetical protein
MSRRVSVWVAGVLCAAVCGFFWTGMAGAAELPDGRGYEQVSPEEKYGTEVYQPPVIPSYAYETEVEHPTESNAETEFTFQAAADGSGLALVEGPMIGGNESEGQGSGNEYLARRSADGVWSQRLLSPEGAPNSVFEAFTPDLSTAFVSSLQPLSLGAPGYGEVAFGESTYDTLYTVSTNGGEYFPFFSTKPPYRTSSRFDTYGTASYPESYAYGCKSVCLALEGASADYTHLLFAANDALTGASEGRPAAEGGASSEFENENNLYESIDGQLRLVNVLPNGTTHANAAFGGLEEYGNGYLRLILSHDISADGSRIFWTDLNTGHLYMRENDARTVEISAAGTYQTASPDGSAVFFTNGALYQYDVASGQTTDLTPGVTVKQVVGASENDEYIYYVNSEEKLAVLHAGVSKQITTTPIKINPNATNVAEVTPDGRSIVFMQEEEKYYPKAGNNLVDRVEVYDAETETLNCASCTPLGTLGRLEMSNKENMRLPRWISADGSRVFFVSLEGLVPQDVNEEQDVYEWVRPGTGGCATSGGCVYLLTGGTSVGQSSFLDASESGSDVFIVTRANLDGSDEDGAFDAYDVRLGAQQPPVAPLCTGTGCQGIPSAQPIFATPSSVTFEGVGNFAAPGKQAKAKPKPKKKPSPKLKRHKKGKNGKSKAKKSARRADAGKRSGSKGGQS